jgi:hypothetical protein
MLSKKSWCGLNAQRQLWLSTCVLSEDAIIGGLV